MTRVYFIRCHDAIKIGMTRRHPMDRLYDLQAGCPYDLELVAWLDNCFCRFEPLLHKFFRAYRIHREWFKSDPVLTFIPTLMRHKTEVQRMDENSFTEVFGATYTPNVNYGAIVVHQYPTFQVDMPTKRGPSAICLDKKPPVWSLFPPPDMRYEA